MPTLPALAKLSLDELTCSQSRHTLAQSQPGSARCLLSAVSSQHESLHGAWPTSRDTPNTPPPPTHTSTTYPSQALCIPCCRPGLTGKGGSVVGDGWVGAPGLRKHAAQPQAAGVEGELHRSWAGGE